MGFWSYLPGSSSSGTTTATADEPPSKKQKLEPSPSAAAAALEIRPTPLPSAEPLTPFQRTRKQLTLYLAGSSFLLLTTALARKSVTRRYASTFPKFYTNNSTAMRNQEFNGAKDAFEALNIATLGVFSFGMIAVGGAMFATDIISVGEAREAFRRKYGLQGRKSDGEVEEELEEWIAGVLARKDRKAKGD